MSTTKFKVFQDASAVNAKNQTETGPSEVKVDYKILLAKAEEQKAILDASVLKLMMTKTQLKAKVEELRKKVGSLEGTGKDAILAEDMANSRLEKAKKDLEELVETSKATEEENLSEKQRIAEMEDFVKEAGEMAKAIKPFVEECGPEDGAT